MGRGLFMFCSLSQSQSVIQWVSEIIECRAAASQLKKDLVQKNLGPKNTLVKRSLVQKKYGEKEIR